MTSTGPPRPSVPSLALREVLLAAAMANRAVARHLQLGSTDLAALDHLLAGARPGTHELADLLGIRSPSATGLVDRLEAAGLVRRIRHPVDRRRIVLEPTHAAQARTAEVIAPLLSTLDALAHTLTPREQEVVVKHLQAVADVLRRFPQDVPEDADH